ncbi:MAG: ABC transporter ATP-binding protein [Chitinophagaceae bacterium]|nr:ABC transporter ATP-binding protein [Oligoflexus sp.]
MTTPILKVEDLSVKFEDKVRGSVMAVKGISFELYKGKSLAIVGESGSGKSVSSLALMGLLPPTARVEARAMQLSELDLLRLDAKSRRHLCGKRMAMIFQEPMSSLNPLVPVGDQIIETLLIHMGLNKKAAVDRALELIDQVGLPIPRAIYKRYPHELSGGQQQRIMIAMGIACEPDLLIADEPTTALDVTIQKQVIELLLSLQEKYQMSLLFITHDLALVADLADDVAVMYRGEMIETGKTMDVFSQPKQAYTRGLLACRPPLNKRPRRLLTVSDFVDNKVPSVDYTPRVSQTTPDIVLELKSLTKTYEQKKDFFAKPELFHAVDHVDLKVKKGMRLGIVGESGCGKTTLARSIIRLVEPTSGAIIFDGQDITHLSEIELMPIRRRIQYIFQNPYAALNPRMTIGEIVTEPLVIHGLGGSQQERWNAAAEQLESVGLSTAMLQRFPHEFSGGQRQRICIARALMLNPEILVCDECVSALDVSVQAQILNLLQDIQDKRGITFLFISHDLAVVRYFSEEVCVMSKGQIIERGGADEIYAHPQHSFTQRLLNAIPKGIPKGALSAAPSYY